MHKSGDLLQLAHQEAPGLPLQVQGRDAVLVFPVQQNGGKLGQAFPSADGGVDEVFQQAHHGDLAAARRLAPLPMEVFVAHAQHSSCHSDLLLHPLARVLHTGRVVATR